MVLDSGVEPLLCG